MSQYVAFERVIARLVALGLPVVRHGPGRATSICPACLKAGRGEVSLTIRAVRGGVQFGECEADER
jgi:hypothetical protein